MSATENYERWVAYWGLIGLFAAADVRATRSAARTRRLGLRFVARHK